MKIVKFIIEIEIPEEDLMQAEQDAWRYFWSEIENQMWESKVEIQYD